MKLAIHFPNHEWFSAALGEKVEINFCYCDLKSGPIWINDSWGEKYQLNFGAGHLHDEWEDVEFGPEKDPTQELDKFFGQEVPIYVSGAVGDGYPGKECGDKIPGFDSHCLDSRSGFNYFIKRCYDKYHNLKVVKLESDIFKVESHLEQKMKRNSKHLSTISKKSTNLRRNHEVLRSWNGKSQPKG